MPRYKSLTSALINARSKRKSKAKYSRDFQARRQVFSPARGLPVGFPRTNRVKLRYVENVSVTPGQLAGQYFFRANSCFDPNYTGTGHQPSGYDIWATFYNHYCVTASTCKVMIATPKTAQAGLVVYGVFLSDDPTVSTTLETIMEQSHSTNGYAFANTDYGIPKAVYKTYNANKFFNTSNVKDNFSRYGAVITNDPTEVAFFCVFVGDTDTAVSLAACVLTVEIEYDVYFSEPKELAQS